MLETQTSSLRGSWGIGLRGALEKSSGIPVVFGNDSAATCQDTLSFGDFYPRRPGSSVGKIWNKL